MHPGTDAQPAGEGDNDATEGAAYAHSLLARIRTGVAEPADLAILLEFLASGSMLHAACAVIFAAIRAATTGRAGDDPHTGT